jgi:hypothetical protein
MTRPRITPRFVAGRFAVTDRMAEAVAAQQRERARREAYAHCDRAPFGWELRA